MLKPRKAEHNRMAAPYRNGNGLGANLPVVISTLVVVLTIIGGFWSIANPRDDIRDIKISYLTKAEHGQFKESLDRDIRDIKRELLRLREETVPKSTHDLKWKDDAERLARLADDVKDVRFALGSASTIKDILDKQQRSIEELREWFRQSHVNNTVAKP